MAEDLLVWKSSTAAYRKVKITGEGSFHLAEVEVREWIIYYWYCSMLADGINHNNETV